MSDFPKISLSEDWNETVGADGVRVRRLPAHLDPIQVLERLEGLPGRVLLETVPPWSGRCMVAAGPVAVVRGEVGRAELWSEPWIDWGGEFEPGSCGGRGGLHLLGRAIESLRRPVRSDRGPSGAPSGPRDPPDAEPPSSSAHAPLPGGWFGMLGYELAGEVECLPAREDLVEERLPDLWFGVYDWAVSWPDGPEAAPVLSGRPLPGDSEGRELERRLVQIEDRLTGESEPDARAGAGAGPSGDGGSGVDSFGGGASMPEAGAARADVARAWEPIGVADAPEVRISLSRERYLARVERIREYIRAGDLFQANLTCQIERTFGTGRGAPADGVALYRAMRARSPAPYAAYLEIDGRSVVSISPECFLSIEGSRVYTRPIKGTRPRGRTPVEDRTLRRELVRSAKDRAENVMIVDLLRNDLSQIAKPNSVSVSVLLELETHPTVHHLVSQVECELRSGVDWSEILAALFPGGSITGAPKIRAMQILRELEPVRRGPYTGSLGWIGFEGEATLSIAIRTAVLDRGIARYGAGGGITLASEPEAEWNELLDKARAFLEATRPPSADSAPGAQ